MMKLRQVQVNAPEATVMVDTTMGGVQKIMDMPEAITPTRKFVITKLRSNDEVRYYKVSIKRGGSLLQIPKKCAEDLKLEIRQTEILVISINFVIGERCRILNPCVLLDYAYVIL